MMKSIFKFVLAFCALVILPCCDTKDEEIKYGDFQPIIKYAYILNDDDELVPVVELEFEFTPDEDEILISLISRGIESIWIDQHYSEQKGAIGIECKSALFRDESGYRLPEDAVIYDKFWDGDYNYIQTFRITINRKIPHNKKTRIILGSTSKNNVTGTFYVVDGKMSK